MTSLHSPQELRSAGDPSDAARAKRFRCRVLAELQANLHRQACYASSKKRCKGRVRVYMSPPCRHRKPSENRATKSQSTDPRRSLWFATATSVSKTQGCVRARPHPAGSANACNRGNLPSVTSRQDLLGAGFGERTWSCCHRLGCTGSRCDGATSKTRTKPIPSAGPRPVPDAKRLLAQPILPVPMGNKAPQLA